MSLSRLALFGASLALPAALAGGAVAQPAAGTRVIQVPPGAVVLILGAPGAAPASAVSAAPDSFPMMRLIAEQQAIVRHMVAEMNAMFPPMPDPSQFPPMPDPSQLIQAAMGAGGMPGHGVCGESVTYTFNGNGSRPVVHVRHYGDACGPAAPGDARNVMTPRQPEPVPEHQPKVLEIGYPPHPVSSVQSPRT